MSGKTSRPTRWSEAVEKLAEAASELRELYDEYQEWRDGIPENMEDSATAQKLDDVLALDIDELETVVDDFQGLGTDDLPKGFGRDNE